MDTNTETPTVGKTADEILKSKAKVERARLKRIADRETAKAAPKPEKAKSERKAIVKKVRKLVKKAAKKTKAKATSAACVRLERLDMRLSKAEKTRVVAKAKKLRRTITSVVLEAIEKIK